MPSRSASAAAFSCAPSDCSSIAREEASSSAVPERRVSVSRVALATCAGPALPVGVASGTRRRSSTRGTPGRRTARTRRPLSRTVSVTAGSFGARCLASGGDGHAGTSSRTARLSRRRVDAACAICCGGDRLEQVGQLVEQLGPTALLLEDRGVGGAAEDRVDLAQVAADHARDGALHLARSSRPSVASRSSSSATVSMTESAETSLGVVHLEHERRGVAGVERIAEQTRGSRRRWSRSGP